MLHHPPELRGGPLPLDDAPVLEANVNVGRVTIGDGAAIGANAVVLADVPAGALATGIPAVMRGG